MELVLPVNYVDVTEEEMMYVDGGWDAKSYILGALSTAVGAFVGKAISQSLIGKMIGYAAKCGLAWAVNQINTAVYLAILNPGAAIGVALVAVAALGTVYYVGKRNKWF